MPSTYTLNNGIELIATGEQSGTWGDTTNLNLGLVDTALDGQVTVTLPAAGTSGAPNALPISDGAASNGRNRLIIFADGGDLGATAFVQLTPNDAEKIVYIRNNLSGGRAIALFQGTYNAANDYEVPAGTTAVVFFNGGGAGAVAANVFNNAFFDSLRLGGVSVTAILDEDNMASDSATALATQQSIKAYVDAQVGANNELSEVLANGNTSGGNNIQMTTTDEVQFRDTALTIKSSVDGQLDIAADVELEIVAPTLDINASTAVTIDTTTLTMTGSVNVVGDLDVDNLNLNGNTIISTNTDGNIALTPNGTGEVDISKVDIDGGTIDGTVIGGSTAAAISGTTGSFSGNLTVDTNTLFVDAGTNNVGIGTVSPSSFNSAADNLVVGTTSGDNGITIATGTANQGSLFFADGTASGAEQAAGYLIYLHNTNAMAFGTSNTERLRIDSSGNLLVGTTSAPNGTSVYGSGFVGETNSRKVLRLATSSTAQLSVARFYNPNGQVGEIKTEGTSTLYVTSSDYRLKTDAQPMTGASARVQALKPVNFEWIADGTRVDGFLAHEAQAIVPAAVTGEKDGEEMQAIDHSKLVPLLTAALQEALTEIADLKARVAALEA
jgi:cytoskeletal protein CcmA (bactofilin family)